MLKKLARAFGFENKTETFSKSDIISYANSVLMGLGSYACGSMSDDWPEWAKKMQKDLELFEQ